MVQAGLALDEIVDLPPGPGREGALTVTLWLARDPRLLIADTSLLPTGTA